MSTPPNRHSLADHRFGALANHLHSGDEDHEHDEDPRHDLLTPQSRELEAAPFVSVGVDIGSTTTQIAFSRLQMRGPGEPVSLRRLLKSRETIWLSQPVLTPWRGADVDVDAVRDIVDRAFEESGLHPDDIEAGAVILTGDAATTSNARRLVDVLSEDIGDLVSAVAGHHMEALLAAYGSGAVQLSLETGDTLVLADIGGGTTKLARIVAGRVSAVGALRIGARLVVFDGDGRISKLAREAADFAHSVGLSWELGERVSPKDAQLVADAMIDALMTALDDPYCERIAKLWLTKPIAVAASNEPIMASGGVAEYVFERQPDSFGDLGPALGRGFRRALRAANVAHRLCAPGSGIRATVLGAAEHSLQISGETGFVSSPAKLLPQRNLPVVAPNFSFIGDIDRDALASAIAQKRAMLDLLETSPAFALALRWRGDADHERLFACARGIAAGMGDRIAAGKPIFILMEGDAALNLAGVLRDELNISVDLLALDGIVLRDFDWVDIGRLRLPSNTIPVTVKSLVFAGRQNDP